MFLITSSDEFKEAIASYDNNTKVEDTDEHQPHTSSNQDNCTLVNKNDKNFRALLDKVLSYSSP